MTQSFRPHYGPVVDSASNRNEYQEYFLGGKGGRCVGKTTLPPSCVDCLQIWEPQTLGNIRACPGLTRIALPLSTIQQMLWCWYDNTSNYYPTAISQQKLSLRIILTEYRSVKSNGKKPQAVNRTFRCSSCSEKSSSWKTQTNADLFHTLHTFRALRGLRFIPTNSNAGKKMRSAETAITFCPFRESYERKLSRSYKAFKLHR